MANRQHEAPIEGQVAIITGGGQGIGRAIALRLASDGMDVIIADLKQEPAAAVVKEIQASGRRGLAIACDVGNQADREQLLARTLAEFGRLDVLVNNAGIQRASEPLAVTEDHWDMMISINAKAVYFLCQSAMNHFMAQRSGRIVNIASMAGKAASTIYHPVYNVSKAAVIAMTKTFAHIGASSGIRVNAVCPGVIETAMQDLVDTEFGRLMGREPAQVRAERTSRIPVGRPGDPDDVASVVAFLAGPDSGYMTGQALNVTGGMLMY